MKVIGAVLKQYGPGAWEARIAEHPDAVRAKASTWIGCLAKLTSKAQAQGLIPDDCVCVETQESAQARFVVQIGGHFDGPHPLALFLPANAKGDYVQIETYARVGALPDALRHGVRRHLRDEPPEWLVLADCPSGHRTWEGHDLPPLDVLHKCETCGPDFEGVVHLSIAPRVILVPKEDRGGEVDPTKHRTDRRDS